MSVTGRCAHTQPNQMYLPDTPTAFLEMLFERGAVSDPNDNTLLEIDYGPVERRILAHLQSTSTTPRE